MCHRCEGLKLSAWNILTLMRLVLEEEVFPCEAAGDVAGGLLLARRGTGAAAGGRGSSPLHGFVLRNTAETSELPPNAIIIN